MKKEVFLEVLRELKNAQTIEDKLYDAGLDATNINDSFHRIVTHLIGTIYGDEGLDIFYWWFYDKEFGTREDLKMGDAKGNEICRTAEELYDYLEANKTDDYELAPILSDEERMAIFKSVFGG
jgi:hypothetical protein